MSPAKAKSLNDVLKLKTDGWTGKDYWLLIDGRSVFIRAQRLGEESTQNISIPRRTFQRMVDWYLKEQR